jgi:hypothetical protein
VTRLLAACGLVVGGALLARPQQVADRVAPAFPDRPVIRASSAIDLLHAASMVPFVASARYGRAARMTGVGAAAYAAVALTLADKSQRR